METLLQIIKLVFAGVMIALGIITALAPIVMSLAAIKYLLN